MPYSHLLGAKASKLDRCKCGARVSLNKPDRRASAAPWQCLRCGSIFLAAPQRRDGSEFHGGIRRADFNAIYQQQAPWFDLTPSRLSEEGIAQLRNCTDCVQLPDHELRQAQRYAVSVPLTVIALDERFSVAGPPTLAYSIDVSAGGMSLLYPDPTNAPLYAIEVIDAAIRLPPVILRPVRCSRLGQGYSVAGEFICRVDY